MDSLMSKLLLMVSTACYFVCWPIFSVNDKLIIYEYCNTEFMGHYHDSIVEIDKATDCYKQAYKYYSQWGAFAKAKKLKDCHSLDVADSDVELSLKHRRSDSVNDWEITACMWMSDSAQL